MILIAESGSSKTDWRIVGQDFRVSTRGINPLFLDDKALFKELSEHFSLSDRTAIRQVYFYGPGCGIPERCFRVHHPLSQFFNKASVEVNSDLVAAVRALFRKEKGIACILGTGANSALYDGREITQKALSLGYILGDEGSGAHIGKAFIKHYLQGDFEPDLQELLSSKITLTTADVIEQVYRQAYPNRFLAGFAPLVKKYIHFESVQHICQESFTDFLKQYVMIYPEYPSLEVSFVGSIAFHFQDLIRDLAEQHSIRIGQFVEKPIDLLLDYHKHRI